MQCLCKLTLSVVLTAFAFTQFTSDVPAAEPIKVGVIGMDNYQCVAFTNLFHRSKEDDELSGIKVVAAFPGGSPDIEESVQSLPRWVDAFKKMKIEQVGSIDAVLKKVDAVLVMSLDGRTHLEYTTAALKAGKPVYIGRPLAASLEDAIEIFRRAKQYKTPIFTCSQHRFVPGFIGMRNHPQVGKVLGCSVYGGLTTEPHHGEFFWHGVHSAETLFTIMGTGCVSVTRTSTPDFELVTGVWKDGRIGTYRAMKKGAIKYSGIVFGDKGILRAGNYGYGVPTIWTPAKGEKSSAPKGEHWIATKGEYMGYKGVAIEIAKFFKTGKPPVTAAETIEIFAFLEAAHESKRQDGARIKLQTVIDKAQPKK
jgi:predicted dehydrogenase